VWVAMLLVLVVTAGLTRRDHSSGPWIVVATGIIVVVGYELWHLRAL
jgi:hypothetical protein